MKCYTQTCRRFISKGAYRCEPCADKYAEKIRAYTANSIRQKQMEDFEGELSVKSYHRLISFIPKKLTTKQAFLVLRGALNPLKFFP